MSAEKANVSVASVVSVAAAAGGAVAANGAAGSVTSMGGGIATAVAMVLGLCVAG